jgi:D-threonate/D-erythronate kinase
MSNHQVISHALKTTILIIADDLTGAADSAVQFRQAGFSAIVLARPAKHQARLRGAQVVSLNLNTRDASPATVRGIWKRQAPTIQRLAPGALVYQKIDSTLRGHPALEVRLLLDCLDASAAIVAPAFPKLGRTTIDGVHRVHGVPLADTEYARTQTRLRATSHLPELLAFHDGERPVHLPWQVIDGGFAVVAPWLQDRLHESCQLITADAADERHLDILTQAVLPLVGKVLMVGSAGWAERLASACRASMADVSAGPGALGIVGSLSATATRQVQVASQAGMTVVRYPSLLTHAMAGETVGNWQTLTQALGAGQSAVIWTHPDALGTVARPAGQRVLRSVAATVRELLSTTPVSGLVLVGGDTAQVILRALHASGLMLIGEVAPGLPYGRLLDGPWSGLPVATKAGGFGADTALVDVLKFLQSRTIQ